MFIGGNSNKIFIKESNAFSNRCRFIIHFIKMFKRTEIISDFAMGLAVKQKTERGRKP